MIEYSKADGISSIDLQIPTLEGKPAKKRGDQFLSLDAIGPFEMGRGCETLVSLIGSTSRKAE